MSLSTARPDIEGASNPVQSAESSTIRTDLYPSRQNIGSRRLLRALPYLALVTLFAAPPAILAWGGVRGADSALTVPQPAATIEPQPFPDTVIHDPNKSYDRTRDGKVVTPIVRTPPPGSWSDGQIGGSSGGLGKIGICK